MWSMLLVTLPSRPNAVRLRVWRALKAAGSAALRDGAYVLPAEQARRFGPIAEEVRANGGAAHVFDLSPRDASQRDEIVAMFDRSHDYAGWRTAARALHDALPRLTETEARRRLRSLRDALSSLREIDFHPGVAATQAEGVWHDLLGAVDAAFSSSEPSPQPAAGIARLDPKRFSGKRWATRARPWVDRLASAWLILRFVDTDARFVWLKTDPPRPPRGAIGFDFDGARFTHVGPRVTFEVIAASFGLDADPALQRIGQSVRYLDVGGIPAPEAAGVEAILAGLRALRGDDDDGLADAANRVFDALYASQGAA